MRLAVASERMARAEAARPMPRRLLTWSDSDSSSMRLGFGLMLRPRNAAGARYRLQQLVQLTPDRQALALMNGEWPQRCARRRSTPDQGARFQSTRKNEATLPRARYTCTITTSRMVTSIGDTGST